jgi:hypothetical protein
VPETGDHCRPGHLGRQEDQQNDGDPAAHGGGV